MWLLESASGRRWRWPMHQHPAGSSFHTADSPIEAVVHFDWINHVAQQWHSGAILRAALTSVKVGLALLACYCFNGPVDQTFPTDDRFSCWIGWRINLFLRDVLNGICLSWRFSMGQRQKAPKDSCSHFRPCRKRLSVSLCCQHTLHVLSSVFSLF